MTIYELNKNSEAYSFNTTGMANYRVQLAVPSIIIIILFLKKLTNKYTKKLGIFS